MTVTAFPLAWPAGWPRTAARGPSPFKVSREKAITELDHELHLMGATNPILSTSVARRFDGRMGASEPADPGVAIYFTRKDRQMVFACDRWRTVRENIRAVVLTIAALRGLERWGASDMMERAFAGFEALPAPSTWRAVLGLPHGKPTEADVDAAWKARIKVAHPDAGGTALATRVLNEAREQAIREIQGKAP